MTPQAIADQTLRTIETGIEKGRHVIDALVATAPRRRERARRLPLGPFWIGAGLVAGAAILLQGGRRSGAGAAPSRRRLRDVMVSDVHTLHPDATVLEAAESMRQKNVGVLPITDAGQVIGVVTDRDLVVRVLAKGGTDPAAVRVRECATANPIVARDDWTPERALLVMAEQQIGRLPVVDERGRLAGMVTLSSLALRSQRPDETLAAARKVSLRSAREDAA
jgi:CBS domain-containing protein